MLYNCTGFFSHAVALLKINSFQNVLEGYHLNKCQTVRIQIRPDFLSDLIWVQTVCKGYQQSTKIVPIRTHLLQTAHMKQAKTFQVIAHEMCLFFCHQVYVHDHCHLRCCKLADLSHQHLYSDECLNVSLPVSDKNWYPPSRICLDD